MQKKPGYIIIFVLLLISLSTILVTYVADKSSVFVPSVRVYKDREQAYLLALSGVQVAMNKLALVPEQKGQKSTTARVTPKNPEAIQDEHAQFLLASLLPVLNRWQTFSLTEHADGIEGEIKLCIMCEDGKLDLNAFYDFEKNTFMEGTESQHIKALLEQLFARIGKKMNTENLFASYIAFLSERGTMLNDPTQLLLSKPFAPFKDALFYDPSVKTESKQGAPLYLTDLFTVWTGKKTLQPWLLSASIADILQLQRTKDIDKNLASLLKDFKREGGAPKEVLVKLYQADLNAIPKNIELLLSAKFEPTVFSVLSYGIFGSITQRIFAILERIPKNAQDTNVEYDIKIRKLYWL
jgi:hypothetical protein